MHFRDLTTQYNNLKPEIDKAIQEVIDSAKFILGTPVTELETVLAAYVGVKHCITCANGTDAITLVLRAWGIGSGDAVFVPDFTYIATASSLAVLGAEPVFVDIDSRTFNISPDALELAINTIIREEKLTPKAIIPVDLFGLPADYEKISKIAEKYDLLLLEDGAQGFGSVFNGQRACSFGDAATTSFFPAKPLGCYGDGGAIFTNDDILRDNLKMLRINGASLEDKYDNKIIGVNSRLDSIQAAVLLVKMNVFDDELDKVNRTANRYSDRLGDLVATPCIPYGYLSSWAQYTVVLPDKTTRDILQSELKAVNIPTMVYYPKPLHRQTAFSRLDFRDDDFPNTIKMSECVLSLPMHPYISNKDIDTVCNGIKSILH